MSINYAWFGPLWEAMTKVERHELFEATMQVVICLHSAGWKALHIAENDLSVSPYGPPYTSDWEKELPYFNDLIHEMEARDPDIRKITE